MGEFMFLLFASAERMEFGITRAAGIIGNPNYACYFQLIGFISLICIPKKERTKYNFTYLIALTIVTLSIFVTFSRTGLITLLISILTYTIIQRKRTSLLITFFIFLASLPYINNVISNTRYGVIMENNEVWDATLGGRTTSIWNEKMEQFTQKPLFGIGAVNNPKDTSAFYSAIFDNSFIFLLVSSGLIGFCILLFFFIAELYYFFFKRKNAPQNLWLFIILFNISIIIFFITTDLIRNVTFTSFFYFVLGISVTYANKKSQINEPVNLYTNPQLEPG
ncbi:MAG: O-antigen ligase family protein [Chitinophagaceae bacterium]|nr:O-antigen ligase family protein [Chitinophagaceae bacterium]